MKKSEHCFYINKLKQTFNQSQTDQKFSDTYHLTTFPEPEPTYINTVIAGSNLYSCNDYHGVERLGHGEKLSVRSVS